MAGLNTVVTTLSLAAGETLRQDLEKAGYAFRQVQHACFAAKGEQVNVVFYQSGKLVVQGKGAENFQTLRLLCLEGGPQPRLLERTIGADETGKGDYFGPLVVAACALSPAEERFLDVPLRDSKTLSDAQNKHVAKSLSPILPHEVIVIGPARYNELYEEFGNLNLLLAWAHAKAINTLVERTGCKRVVLDRFCDESKVLQALGSRGLDLDLEVRPRAEDNPAVAAASIMARATFLTRLEALSKRIGQKLPKGAGSPVLKAGRALVQDQGREILAQVAKLHFKTTGQIGG